MQRELVSKSRVAIQDFYLFIFSVYVCLCKRQFSVGVCQYHGNKCIGLFIFHFYTKKKNNNKNNKSFSKKSWTKKNQNNNKTNCICIENRYHALRFSVLFVYVVVARVVGSVFQASIKISMNKKLEYINIIADNTIVVDVHVCMRRYVNLK